MKRKKIESFKGKYVFLSNFYPCPIYLLDEWYPSVEHAYQAAKTLNPLERKDIRTARTAAGAKKAGRRITLRPDWDQVKLDIMRDLLTQKFTDPVLRAALKATEDTELVEGNWWGDRFWGVCKGVGENHLGHLLMDIRDKIT